LLNKSKIDEIITALEQRINCCTIDTHNESTVSWSKGFKKGIVEALWIIKDLGYTDD